MWGEKGWGGRLLTFSAFRMGAYSRWALIRGWALIRINTVVKCAIFKDKLRQLSPYNLDIIYNVCTVEEWANVIYMYKHHYKYVYGKTSRGRNGPAVRLKRNKPRGKVWLKKQTNKKYIMKMKKWLSQWTQFMQLREEAWKKLFQTSSRNFINCVHCEDRFFIFISFPLFIYDLFHISLTKNIYIYTKNS